MDLSIHRILLCDFVLRLANGAEQLHLLAYGSLDSFHAGSQNLTGVKALANQILTLFDILAGSLGECDLALGVYVDLANAQIDCLLDHIGRNAGTAVQNQGHITGGVLDSFQHVETEAGPVCRVFF